MGTDIREPWPGIVCVSQGTDTKRPEEREFKLTGTVGPTAIMI